MYNFNLMEDEKIVEIFDEEWVKQGENVKVTTIALTNKRLLFLDYINMNDGIEVLRIARGVSYVRNKEVYYQINLVDIHLIEMNEYYKVILKNGSSFEFDNVRLYELLNK